MGKKIKFLFTAASLLLGISAMQGVVAKPGLIEARQPDGTTKLIRMEGGPKGHQIFSEDDVLLMHDKNGFYVPADEDFKTRVEKKRLERSNAEFSDSPATRSLPGLMSNPFPSSGPQKALVILVEFPNCTFTIKDPVDHYDKLLNGVNYIEDGATGSARQYYTDNSNGLFDISFDIYGPVTMDNNYEFYGANDYWGDDINPHLMVIEACEKLNDKINYGDYDKNGDGQIDIVYIFYAGYGEADGGGLNTIWPHSAGVYDDFVMYKYFDKKLLNHYACSMELQYYSTDHLRPDGIGTFCHEFCHVLGLPDLYSTIGGGAFTPGEWTLMDVGSYNNDSRTPPHLSGFERAALGWLDPVKLNPGDYTLNPLGNDYNEAFIIPASSQNEYFIIENRQQKGWDQYLPHHGMLVWHIDYDLRTWNNNTVNINARHQRVDLVEADGIPSNWTIDGDAFPGLYEKTEFTQYTNPALLSWDNRSLGIGIREIKEVDGLISFSISDLQGISLSASQLSLHAPETANLSVTFNPSSSNQWNLVWSSSDPAVAEVDEQGKITAHKSGNAKISVYVEQLPDIKASCDVAVVPYKLIYMVDEETYITQQYDAGATITKPKDPIKEGSSFKEWLNLPATMPAQDLTVSALFDLNDYTIIYLIDGSEYKKETVKYGAKITPPAPPVKEGYSFTGWSGIPETMPAGNITVEAVFAINSYQLTYYVDNTVYNQQTIEYGSDISPLNEPSKQGYTFSGWSNIPPRMPANDIDVFGSFSINSHNVYFIVDDALYHTASVTYGAAIPLPQAPVKEGNVFAGWSGLPSSMPDADVTVSATFDKQLYAIRYYVDDGFYNEEKKAFGDRVTPLANPQKEGYTFTGWQGVPEIMPARNVDVNGSFSINSHKVTFMVDGKDYFSSVVTYGSDIPLPESPGKEGYSFKGWSNLPSTMPDNDITVTALFTANSYLIVYYLDGMEYNKQTWNFGSRIQPLPAPVKTGHTFNGWIDLPATMPASDIKVYGSFSVNTYTVTFLVDGDEYHKITLEYGASLQLPDEPLKEGHSFMEWSGLPEIMPDEDVVVEASFLVNEYEIIYYLNNIEFKRQNWKFAETIVPLSDPQETGYTFSGWKGILPTMPAHDIVVQGYLYVNSYNIFYYVDDELVEIQTLEFGEKIIPPVITPDEDRIFDGWTTPIPATMPAEDISIYGYTRAVEAGIDGVFDGIGEEFFDIYSPGGTNLRRKVHKDELKKLSPGIYILRSPGSTYKIKI